MVVVVVADASVVVVVDGVAAVVADGGGGGCFVVSARSPDWERGSLVGDVARCNASEPVPVGRMPVLVALQRVD